MHLTAIIALIKNALSGKIGAAIGGAGGLAALAWLAKNLPIQSWINKISGKVESKINLQDPKVREIMLGILKIIYNELPNSGDATIPNAVAAFVKIVPELSPFSGIITEILQEADTALKPDILAYLQSQQK